MTQHRIDFRGEPSLDPRLSVFDRAVLAVIDQWPGVQRGFDTTIGFPTLSHIETAGPRLTLDLLVASAASRSSLLGAKPQVFFAVARLEEFGYLPVGAVR
jgi:hypothetical protein